MIRKAASSNSSEFDARRDGRGREKEFFGLSATTNSSAGAIRRESFGKAVVRTTRGTPRGGGADLIGPRMSRRVGTWQGNTIVQRDFTMGASMGARSIGSSQAQIMSVSGQTIFEATGRFGPAKSPSLGLCHLALQAPVALEQVSVSEIVLGGGRKRRGKGLTTENTENRGRGNTAKRGPLRSTRRGRRAPHPGRVCSPELLRRCLKSFQSGSSRIRLPPDHQRISLIVFLCVLCALCGYDELILLRRWATADIVSFAKASAPRGVER